MTRNSTVTNFVKSVVENMPEDWLNLTTHRLDIYNEERAKTEFLDALERLLSTSNATKSALATLPTAYDYIRLGHPLSCLLEWTIAHQYNTKATNVIAFSSKSIPILAILRKNLLDNVKTQIVFKDNIPDQFTNETLQRVYGYHFEVLQVADVTNVTPIDGTTIYVSEQENICDFSQHADVDFFVNFNKSLGSVLMVNNIEKEDYISEIQHVRRRETIAITPNNALIVLKIMTGNQASNVYERHADTNKAGVLKSIRTITGSNAPALVSSSGLSMQYAIVMGLIDYALENHPSKAIKIVVPPNCYGGTNDQARRVAACIENVEIVDLPVDGDNDMVTSVDVVLDTIAQQDAVPFIIAEIPTNPRVEVPDRERLQNALTKQRTTPSGNVAIAPVFILDQTFCPNTHFLRETDTLAAVQTISYVSGSKFPSGGRCTAGYCTANKSAAHLMDKIALHLNLCDNEATPQQLHILAEQMPSMVDRIAKAYTNTRAFVDFIADTLPEAKINFVSNELAAQGFTPSVFSLDLPTKGNTEEKRESHKKMLNLKLIEMMITQIPNESKYCVSYGQLKGCYWTIPATSTQGTTKEGDKDYIARVAVSPDLDLYRHKAVFKDFVENVINA